MMCHWSSLLCTEQFGKRGRVDHWRGAVPSSLTEGTHGPSALDVEWTFQRRNISTKGGDYHEGDRCDGPGRGNGRDDVGGAAEATGGDQRRRRSGSCVGIHLG